MRGGVAQLKKVGKIEVEEDLQFLKREWRFQRIGWFVMLLLLLAALIGAFGRGPLSETRIGDPRVFSAEFSRMVRHGAIDELKIFVGPGLQSDSTVRIGISRTYLAEFKIEDVQPEPSQQEAAGDFITYQFIRTDPRSPLEISLKLRPEGYASVRGRLQLNHGGALELRQFIMP